MPKGNNAVQFQKLRGVAKNFCMKQNVKMTEKLYSMYLCIKLHKWQRNHLHLMKLDRFDDLEQNQFDIRYSIGQPETVL